MKGEGKLFYKLRLDPCERELTETARVEENEQPLPEKHNDGERSILGKKQNRHSYAHTKVEICALV
jgi:hypothetical protein